MARSHSNAFSCLPTETIHHIYQHLDEATLYGSLPSVSKVFLAQSTATPRRSASFTLRSDNAVQGFTKWLCTHGSDLEQLQLVAPPWDPMVAAAAKTALWAALSNPSSMQRLSSLQLDMIFTPDDEAAVIGAVCASAANLRSVKLTYQRPMTQNRRPSSTCFCTHSSPALWAGAAHLRELRITGACLCNMKGVVQLTNLEVLEVSCCSTADALVEFHSVLRSLRNLRSCSYTTSKPALLSTETARVIAEASMLTHLELGNFALPMCSSGATFGLDAAVVPPAAAATAAAATEPCRMELAQLLGNLRSLTLIDCSGYAASLPLFEGLTQLTAFAVVRSSGHGSVMPMLPSSLFSDSGSDSDSDMDSDTELDTSSSDSDDELLDVDVSDSDSQLLDGSGGESSSGSSGCSSSTAATAAAAVAGKVAPWLGPTTSRSLRLKATALVSLGGLYNLQELDLRGLCIYSIASLCSLQQLKALQLGPAIGSRDLPGHSRDNCAGQLSTRGLAGIVVLQNLEFLDVSYNRLTADCLPMLAMLTKLTYLDLAGNDLGRSCSTGGASGSCCGCQACQLLCGPLQQCSLASTPAASGSSSPQGWTVPGGSRGDSLACGAAYSPPDIVACNAINSVVAAPYAQSASCSAESALILSPWEQQQLLLCSGSKVLGQCPAAVAATAAVAAASAPCSAEPQPQLKHLDISGCGLTGLPNGFSYSSLTSLKAGTALIINTKGLQVTQTNNFTCCAIASLSKLTRLQHLELAANTPGSSRCYAGFSGLTALTKLVLLDPSAAEGVFADSAAAHRCVNSGSEGFKELQELGLMMGSSSARSAGWATAMQQVAKACRGLKRLSLLPQGPDSTAVGDAENQARLSTSSTATAAPVDGYDKAAATEGCCAAGECCSMQEITGPTPAAAVQAAAATAALAVASMECEQGGPLERAGSACSAVRCCSTTPTSLGELVDGAASGCCDPRPGVPAMDGSSSKSPALQKPSPEGWYSSLPGLSGLTRLDLATYDGLSLITAALSGMARLSHLQLLPGCQDSTPTTAAAVGEVPRCCQQPLALGLGYASSNVCGISSRADIGEGLLSLRSVTGLSHLDLQQMNVSSDILDQLQLAMPCTRIMVAQRGPGYVFGC